MKVGDTFYLRGPENPRPHLWAVISDPSINPREVVIVNFTTDGPRKDRTCILQGGAHKCLPGDSCANYPKARLFSDEQLEAAKSKGALDPQEPLSEDALHRVQEGAAYSEDMWNKHRQVLVDQGLCDAI